MLGVGLALQSLLPQTAAETPPTAVAVEPTPPASQAPTVVIPEVKQEQLAAIPPASATPAVAELPRLVSTEQSSGAPASRLLTLQAVALEDTWLRVEIDGNKRHAILLNSGKTVHWEAQHHFLMTIGNARGTRLMLNGKEVTLPPGRSNVVRDFQITRTFLDAR
jgi:Domain of unknown function (DUF4115)